MKFCLCSCLFDYYVFKVSTKTTFSLLDDAYRGKGVRYTFTLGTIDCFIHVCYSCLFTLMKIRRFNKKLLNEALRSDCQSWQSDSYIERVNGATKTCFENLKFYLNANDYNANYAFCGFCFNCLRQFACNFLYEDFHTFFGILLIKILSDAETENMLAFAFGLSFMFDTILVILFYFF